MGYSISLLDTAFFIAADQQPAALAAAARLAQRTDLMRAGWADGPCCFAWMNDTPFASDWTGPFYTTLAEVFEAWGYPVTQDTDGNIVAIDFDSDKIGQEEALFAALAPYVRAGSYLEWLGEDGARWRWQFDGHQLQCRLARVTYD